MFTSEEQISRRTGKFSLTRFQYLQALVTEFQDTDDEEAKLQVIANLANFAYDPINYEHLRELNVLDLFMDSIDEPNEKIVEFGMGGLCNSCIDPKNASFIVENGGIPLILCCLSNKNTETVISAMTCLYYLLNASNANYTSVIATPPVLQCIKNYKKSRNVRLSNLATLLLETI